MIASFKPLSTTVSCLLVAMVSQPALQADDLSERQSPEYELSKQMHASMGLSADMETFSHDPSRVSYESCAPCHGPAGEGKQAVFAPSLAGQERWYLERQLRNFQEGVRGHHPEDVSGATMRAIALLLKEDSVRDRVLDQIDDFPVTQPKQLESDFYDLEAGKARYTTSCLNCHGEQAEGNAEENAPRLNTLPPWYIARQLRNFQMGIRGEHSADTIGAEMRPFAMAVFREDQILDVSAYIATLLAEEPP